MAKLRSVDPTRRSRLSVVPGGHRGVSPRTPAQDLDADKVNGTRARLEALAAYAPRLQQHDLAVLHTPVVAAISRTDYVSADVDRTRLSVLYRYAVWVLRREGSFASSKLDDQRLHAYRLTGCETLRPSSQNTAFSILRTIRHAAPAQSGIRMARSVVTEPYSDDEWRNYRRAGDDLTGLPWCTDAMMLLDLAGELGLRSSEINAATGLDLTLAAGSVMIVPPGPNRRRLVAPQNVAERLRPWVGRPDHLLRPVYRKRGNTANFVAERLMHHHQGFGGFQARRARHRWIASLLVRPIPTLTVLRLAGLESDNHTLTDIARHLRRAART